MVATYSRLFDTNVEDNIDDHSLVSGVVAEPGFSFRGGKRWPMMTKKRKFDNDPELYWSEVSQKGHFFHGLLTISRSFAV